MAAVPPGLNGILAVCHQDPFVCQLKHLQFARFGAIKDSSSSLPSSVMLGLKELLAFFSLVLAVRLLQCCIAPSIAAFPAEGPCRGNIFWLCSCRQHKPVLNPCPVGHRCNRACEVCAGPLRAEALLMPICPLDPLANQSEGVCVGEGNKSQNEGCKGMFFILTHSLTVSKQLVSMSVVLLCRVTLASWESLESKVSLAKE